MEGKYILNGFFHFVVYSGDEVSSERGIFFAVEAVFVSFPLLVVTHFFVLGQLCGALARFRESPSVFLFFFGDGRGSHVGLSDVHTSVSGFVVFTVCEDDSFVVVFGFQGAGDGSYSGDISNFCH